jgi:hypothetical protein
MSHVLVVFDDEDALCHTKCDLEKANPSAAQRNPPLARTCGQRRITALILTAVLTATKISVQ